MKQVLGCIRRADERYNMIQDGDKICVGVSGGKDSLLLMYGLKLYQLFSKKKYDLCAVMLDLGIVEQDTSGIEMFAKEHDIDFEVRKTDIGDVVFNIRKEKNPCAMCAKMRRGALNELMLERGLNKIALGHHYDDAVETFLMSLLYEGRISCFEPVTYLSRTGITQIRPMLYVGEQAITHFAEKYELPVVHNVCPADKHTKRQEVKELIVSLQAQYPDLKSKIFGAMQRQPLPKWGVEPPQREKR